MINVQDKLGRMKLKSQGYLLEVVKLLLQDLHLLQVGAHLLVGQSSFLLVDPLLQLIGLPEQHELLAALLQHVFAFLSQFQQSAVPVELLQPHSVGISVFVAIPYYTP